MLLSVTQPMDPGPTFACSRSRGTQKVLRKHLPPASQPPEAPGG